MAANQWCSIRGRTLCRPVKFFYTKLPHPCLHGTCFFCSLAHVGTGKRPGGSRLAIETHTMKLICTVFELI